MKSFILKKLLLIFILFPILGYSQDGYIGGDYFSYMSDKNEYKHSYSLNNFFNSNNSLAVSSNDESPFLAILLIPAAPIILSNEIYVFRYFSIVNVSYDKWLSQYPSLEGGGEESLELTTCNGIDIGLRKKIFKKSILEYGFRTENYSNYSRIYIGSNWQQPDSLYYYYDPNNYEVRYTIKFSYLHYISSNTIPNWLDIYLGVQTDSRILLPAVFHEDDWSYGVIIGADIRVHEKVRFTLRNTNEFRADNLKREQSYMFQFGLIWTFQKEYPDGIIPYDYYW